jgi:outer membrane biosynthesis protein TonB
MKTKNLVIALIATIFAASSLMANEPALAPKEISSSVAKIITDEVYYPEFAIDEKFEGKVALEVQITEDGKFDVIAANSVNAELKDYVSQTIENIETTEFKNYSGQKVILNLDYDLKLY